MKAFVYKNNKIISNDGKNELRIVHKAEETGYFGEKYLLLHPHIMDLFNYGGEILQALNEDDQVAYSSEKNAFVIKIPMENN